MDKEKIRKIETHRKIILNRIKQLQTVKRKEYILKLARTGEDSLAIRGDEWDKQDMLLGVLNGVIELENGILRPGNPTDYIVTIAPTMFYGLDFPAPIWEKFLLDIFNNDVELVAYIQRLLGYAITGMTNHHVIPILYGPHGRNGKSTFFEVLRFALGELVYKTRSELLLESRYSPARGAADADTLALRRKRIVWASETDDGRSLNAARLKELCGGDTLNARAPYGKRPVQFSPTHLLFLLTNERPAAPANDDALWERIHLIPFNIRFVDNPHGPNERKADHDLLVKLKAEASGILAWLVRGCLQFQAIGLNPPDSVRFATSEYRTYEDDIGRFILEKCVCRNDVFEKISDIYHEYSLWYELSGLPGKAISLKKLSQRLVNLGFTRDDSGRNVIFKGITTAIDEDL